jgi:hypothetical protein
LFAKTQRVEKMQKGEGGSFGMTKRLIASQPILENHNAWGQKINYSGAREVYNSQAKLNIG